MLDRACHRLAAYRLRDCFADVSRLLISNTEQFAHFLRNTTSFITGFHTLVFVFAHIRTNLDRGQMYPLQLAVMLTNTARCYSFLTESEGYIFEGNLVNPHIFYQNKYGISRASRYQKGLLPSCCARNWDSRVSW